MKKHQAGIILGIILGIFATQTARAVDDKELRLTITLTNTPVTGAELIIGGITRTWTNASTSLTILTNLAAFPTNTSTTNLYANLSAFFLADFPIVLYSSSNALQLIFPINALPTFSETGNWAEFLAETNTFTREMTVRVPYSVEAATNQTNIASMLLDYIEDKAINSFVGGSQATTNMAFLAGDNIFTGANSMIASFFDTPTLTNVLDFTGLMGETTNGYNTNGIFEGGILSNYTAWAGFQSHGSGANSLSLGSNVTASGQQTVAAGDSSSASAFKAIAVGQGAAATAVYALAIGQGTESAGGGSTVIGTLSAATKTNGITIGHSSINDMTNSVVIGNHLTATQTNQILLGSSAQHVTIPGRLEVTGTLSNSVFTATNAFGVSGGAGPYANVQFRRYNLNTVAAGANSIDLNGATYVKLSGPGGAFSLDDIDGGQDGYLVYLTYVGGETWTVANESGAGSGGAEDRILTGTGADFSMTNNPATLTLIFDSEASRWNVLNHSD